MERRFTPTEVRAEENKITGYASVFYREGDASTEYELWNGAKERIDRNAFNRALKEGHDVRALLNHDPNYLLGRTTSDTLSLSVDKRGLKYDIRFDGSDPDHQKVASKIKRGDLNGSSFAFRVTGESWTEEGDQEIRTITDVELIDVGPVVFPAYGATTSGMRAAGHIEEARSSHDQWKLQKETQARLKKLANLK
jgi:HK97 family phage prohead protease